MLYFNATLTLIALTALYFLPTIIAKNRRHHNFASIAIVNLFLGWSGVGWVVALALSVSKTHHPVNKSLVMCVILGALGLLCLRGLIAYYYPYPSNSQSLNLQEEKQKFANEVKKQVIGLTGNSSETDEMISRYVDCGVDRMFAEAQKDCQEDINCIAQRLLVMKANNTTEYLWRDCAQELIPPEVNKI